MHRVGRVAPLEPLDRNVEDGGAVPPNMVVASAPQPSAPSDTARLSGSLSLPWDGTARRPSMTDGPEIGVELSVAVSGGATSQWPTNKKPSSLARFKTLAAAHPALQGINLHQVPVNIRDKLVDLDKNGDGKIDVQEIVDALAHINRRDMKYDLDSFPEAIREDLMVFDQDGDGTVSADEVARACAMYKNAQKKLKMAGRTVAGLVILMLCALGLNAGLTVAVTNLTQDYKLAGDGVMRNKETNNVVATGKVTDAFLFVADADCYAKIRGRYKEQGGEESDTNEAQPDLLAMKPEMMTVVLSDLETGKEHRVTFPVDFMRIEHTWARLGSVQLGYAVNLREAALPEFSFNSWDYNPSAALSAAADNEVRKMAVDMITVYSSKDEIKPYGGSQKDFDKARLKKLKNQSDSGATNTVEAFREVDAKHAGEVAATARLRLPVEDTSNEIKANPKSNVVRSDPMAWMVLLNHTTANERFNEARYLEFCGSLIVKHGGTCTCRVYGTTEVCSREEAVAFNQFQITIREEKLNDLLGDEDMLLPENKYGITQVSKIFEGSGPSIHRSGFHTGDEGHEAHVRQHIMRRRQVREAVFSTHKGHILSAALKQRAVLEEMHAVHISTAVPGAQRRTLKQETTDDLGAYPYDGMHGFGHCYFSSNFSMYRGTVNKNVGYFNSWGGSMDHCSPWTPEEIQRYNVSYLPEDCMAPHANIKNSACASCRHVLGKEEPHCMADTFHGRQLLSCGLPHCIHMLHETPTSTHGHEDLGLWGLERIRRESGAYSDSYRPAEDERALTGEGVHCYIVDSGLELAHDEFEEQRSRGGNFWYDATVTRAQDPFDDNGHGTHVAGIVAGKTVGVAPGCTIHAVRVLNGTNRIETEGGNSAFRGLVEVLKDYNSKKHEAAKAGRPPPPAVVNLSIAGRKSEIWENMVNALHGAGMVVVAAAGNKDAEACQVSPATQANTITVGATAMDDSKSIFSNWGACVQIYAPGSGIRSADNEIRNRYVYMWGSSQAAPFVSGALALFLQAHPQATPDSAARFINNLASSGMVHGVDSRLPDYKQFGYHSTHWADFVDWAGGQSPNKYTAHDESANVDPYDNKLLFVGRQYDLGLNHSSVNGALPLCTNNDAQWGPWDMDESHCPSAGALCGPSRTVLGPPWVPDPGTPRPKPVLKATRACIATDCVCEEEFDYGVVQCTPPMGEAYQFLQGCGLPAAVIQSPQDVDWLQNKWLRFTPQDPMGEFYDVCQIVNRRRPIAWGDREMETLVTQPWTHNLNSAGIEASGKVSLNGRFHFWSKVHGRMMQYDVVYFYANGHIGFAPPSRGTTFLPASDAYSLEAHFSEEKGAGISALFHPMLFSSCNTTGAEDCGELLISYDHVFKRFVLTYRNVISAFAPSDLPQYRSTFQVVLWLEGSGMPAGTFDLIYYKVSQLTQGNAVYGFANGEPYSPAYAISPRKAGAGQTCNQVFRPPQPRSPTPATVF